MVKLEIDIKQLDDTLNKCVSKKELEELKERVLYCIKMALEYKLPQKFIIELYEFVLRVEYKKENLN